MAKCDKELAVERADAVRAAWKRGDTGKAWELYQLDPWGYVRDKSQWLSAMALYNGPAGGA